MFALLKCFGSRSAEPVYDLDPGASEVNQLNRIKLMLSTANKNLEA